MNKLLKIFCLFLFSSFMLIANASETQALNFKSGDQLLNGSTLTVNDHNSLVNGNYHYYVKLIYGRQLKTDISNSTLNLQINYTINGTQHALSINNQNLVALNVHNINTSSNTLTINSITWDASTTLNQKKDVQLELIQVKQTQNCISNPISNINHSIPNEYATLYWEYLENAEEYELEWVFIDFENKNYAGINNLNAFDQSNGFYIEPINIVQSNNHYDLYLSYPKGKLFYRVRGISYDINNEQCFSNWSGVNEIVLNTDFEANYTWQEVTTFAEDGKSKKVISYYDGSNRSRQTLTNLSTDGNVLVAEAMFDFEGRASLNILPTPINTKSIKYVPLLNLNNQGNEYTKEDFDVNIFAGQLITPMLNTSGAAKYYSENNDINTINKAYIPNAQGYPFSHSILTNDATGRPRATSGVGSDMQLGGVEDRVTKYYYTDANQNELRRLFGKNVGNASHYKKTIVRDPNGQMSVSYLDQAGRTIATSLTGDVPTNLIELEDRNPVSMNVDLIEGNNVIDTVGRKSMLSYKHFNNNSGTEFNMQYSFNGIINHLLLLNEAICSSCRYRFEFFIKDEFGNNVDLNITSSYLSSTEIEANYNTDTHIYQQLISKEILEEDCTNVPQNFNFEISFSGNFADIGSYTIVKNLRLLNDDLYASFSDALEFVDTAGLHFEIIDNFLENIDTTICNVTCEQHFLSKCITEYNTLNPSNTITNPSEFNSQHPAWESIQNCINSNCMGYITEATDSITDIECRSLLQQIRDQVDINNNGYYATKQSWWNDATSTLNSAVINNGLFNGTETHRLTIMFDFNSLHYELFGVNTSEPSHYLDALNFIKNNEITTPKALAALATLHPEYCHYLACIANKKSKQYDALMKIEGETFAKAINTTQNTLGRNYLLPIPYNSAINLSNIDNYDSWFEGIDWNVAHDPYFINGPGNTLELRKKVYTDLYLDANNHLNVSGLSLWQYYSPYELSSYMPNGTPIVYSQNYTANPLFIPYTNNSNVFSNLDLFYGDLDPTVASEMETIKERHYTHWREGYLAIKMNIEIERLEAIGCDYVVGNHAVVKDLRLPSDEDGMADFYDENIAELAAQVCPVRINEWRQQFIDNCLIADNIDIYDPQAVSSHTDYIGDAFDTYYRTHFENYCEASIGLGNPLGIIQEHEWTSSPHLQAIQNMINQHNQPGAPSQNTTMCATCDGRVRNWLDKLGQQCGISVALVGQQNYNNLEGLLSDYCQSVPELQNPWRNNFEWVNNTQYTDLIAWFNTLYSVTSNGEPVEVDVSHCLNTLIVPGGYTYAPPHSNGSSATHTSFSIDLCINELLLYAVDNIYPIQNNLFSPSYPDIYINYQPNFTALCNAAIIYANNELGDGGTLALIFESDYDGCYEFLGDDEDNGEPDSSNYSQTPYAKTYSYSDTLEYIEHVEEVVDTTDKCQNIQQIDLDCCCIWAGAWVVDISYDSNGEPYPIIPQPNSQLVSYSGVLESSLPFDISIFHLESPNVNSLNIKAKFLQPDGDTVTAYLIEIIDNCNKIDPSEVVVSPIVNGCNNCPETVPSHATYQNLQLDCINTLVEQARYYADLKFQETIDSLFTPFYQATANNCMNFSEALTMQYQLAEHHYTLYYYDQAGNLTQTVPPEGVKPVPSSNFPQGIWNGTNPQHTLLTQYHYNTLNQVVWQSTPDGGESRFWYDKKGQLVISQNAKQLPDFKASYTKYDNLGRIVEVGEYAYPGAQGYVSYNTVQQAIYDGSYLAIFDPNTSNIDLTQQTYTHYGDDPLYTPQPWQQNLRGRVAKVENRNLVGEIPTATYYSYDEHGNVKELKHLLNNYFEYTIQYQYDLVSGNVNKVIYQPNQADQFIHRYEYDADNRLTNVYTSLNGILWDEDAEYFYYAHGPLARVEIGEDKVQGLDYYYTLHGWLKGINNATATNATDPGNDAGTSGLNRWIGKDEFALNLGYYQGDYTPILASNFNENWTSISNDLVNNEGLYNGNIAYMAQNLAPSSIDPQTGFHPFDLGSYRIGVYQYDQLNRIKQSKSGFYENNQLTMGNKYFSNYSYDANGNITHLKRRDKGGNLFDDFTYNYNTALAGLQNNKLRSVSDNVFGAPASTDIASGQSIDNYEYDEIGNLIADESEEIEEIHWTVYGKVAKVERTNTSTKPELQYFYDAMGNRVAKTVTQRINDPNNPGYTTPDWDNEEITIYVRDASGNVMATYTLEIDPITDEPIIDSKVEYSLYGSSRLGVTTLEIDPQLNTHIDLAWYNLADITILYDKKPLGTISNGDIIEINQIEYVVNYVNALGFNNNIELELELLRNYNNFNKQTGNKMYELSNHLGNVGVVISDMRTGIDENNSTTADYYLADVVSATDYYPFGMQMPLRSYTSENYRFGYNTQERTDEISGAGNHYTAKFWEYDPRLGRRWNLDPKPVPWESGYAVNRNNPIWVFDPLGDFGKNPNDKIAKRQEKAQAKFDKKVTQPLQQTANDLSNQGLNDAQIRTQVQNQADQLADKYQNKRFLHWAYGQPKKHNTNDNSYVSNTTGNKVQEKIKIKAYQQTIVNATVNNERPADGSMTTTGTTGINAPAGSTVNVQFNPLAVDNSLQVTTVGTDGSASTISTTGGMINDPNNQMDVYMFNQTTVLTSSNAGEIRYRVENTRPDAAEDKWQLQIQVTSPPRLEPIPLVESNYPYYQ